GGIEGNPRGRDHRVPVIDGVGEFRVCRRFGNFATIIMRSPAHHRPSVILAGLRDVELISAHRAEFSLPQLAGFRMNGGALRIAMTVGPDLGTRAFSPNEGIVLGDGSIWIDAHNLAERI